MRSQSKSRPERWLMRFFIGGSGLGLLMLFGSWSAYEFIPAVHFQVQSVWSQIYQTIAPQPDIVPTAIPAGTLPTVAPSVTLATSTTPTAPAGPSSTATLVVRTATPTLTPLPASHILTGLKHEYQAFNNCGPASLAINLSYWGWEGSQKNTAAILKPNQDDKNVSPRELYEYLLT